MKKKISALVLALVLALSLGGTTALAATKPSMKLVSVNTTSIKRGKKQVWKYRLSSGSYKIKNGVWRAEYATYLCKGTASNIGTVYAYVDRYFTGKLDRTFNWKVPKSVPKGKYVNVYGTWYRKGTGYSWKVGSAKIKAFKVK